MPSFKFIHAADLHLDSPLKGLAAKSASYARRIDDASRSAFSRLIQLAIGEHCAFILIAGDLFDGQWRDYRTGLYFASQMGLLREAGIDVYIILGNHDAENRFVSRLQLTDNVTLFPSKAPQTIRIESLNVAIHGQSFPSRDVLDNLAAKYPPPDDRCLNIGMLHTALDGREGPALYAPCTVDQLKNHGYAYWALGHVHDYGHQLGASGAEKPYVVYSGVLQGRHIRETGPKGAVLVSVEDDEIVSVEHFPLDSVRWAVVNADVSRCTDMDSVLSTVLRGIEIEISNAGDRALAVRVYLTGATLLHSRLAASGADLRELVETAAAGFSGDVWIETITVRTTDVLQNPNGSSIDPTIAGSIRAAIEHKVAERGIRDRVAVMLDDIRLKMPAGAIDDAFRDAVVAESITGARNLALAVVEKGLE